MNYIEAKVSKVDISDIYKRIEYAGRICYKSDDKISDKSYEKFIKSIIDRGHLSVLEHSNIAVIWSFENEGPDDAMYTYEWLNAVKGETNGHIFITMPKSIVNDTIIISGNVRAWIDIFKRSEKDSPLFNEGFLDMLQTKLYEEYPLFFEPKNVKPIGIMNLIDEKDAGALSPIHRSFTFEVLTNRAITHQIVRHRVLSFSQESQRYCNYSNNKFGGEINYVLGDSPISVKGQEDSYPLEDFKPVGVALGKAEEGYFELLKNTNTKPEKARLLLPNATASTIIITGRVPQFEEFVRLREESHAQEDIQFVARSIQKLIEDDLYGKEKL